MNEITEFVHDALALIGMMTVVTAAITIWVRRHYQIEWHTNENGLFDYRLTPRESHSVKFRDPELFDQDAVYEFEGRSDLQIVRAGDYEPPGYL